MSTSLIPRRRGAAAILAISAAALVAAPAALAEDAQLDSGATVLTLNTATAKALTANGVSVAPVRPAGASKGGKVSFPITGGAVDTDTAAGTVTHSGGLAFRAGGVTVKLTDFTITVGKKSRLVASVGKARVPILDLNVSKAKIARAGAGGTGIRVANVKGTLTGVAASALNKAFDTTLFAKGIPLGTAVVNAVPYQTQLALDAALGTALTGLGITPAPIGPAVAASNGRLSFMVSGGGLAKTNFAGSLEHSGGISLTKGTTVVELKNFTIDTTKATPELTAEIGANRVAILTLDLSAATTGVKGDTAQVGNVVAKLTPGAATALNTAFGTTALAGGVTFGTAYVTAPATK